MTRSVVVVGAGPVGCLAALALHREGWAVTVYETRADMRLPENKSQLVQRSINLAMSSRGITALRAVDNRIADKFLQTAIPMHGRMIHPVNGKEQSQPYDVNGQWINSIDRALLNEDLLNELTAKSIPVKFHHKLLHANFEGKHLTFRDSACEKDATVPYDLCIGADGAYSAVRRQLMRVVRMDYQQEFIPHEYIELRVAPGIGPDGSTHYQLHPNHLHIWPRHSFMLIALPNKDKSFTSTLFAPTSEFEKLKDANEFIDWFRSHFPDALNLIGESRLIEDYKRNPRSPLIHIKARPYHYKDSVVILGDAAHAMVPFYGQGLNCGLEDVRVLDILLQRHAVDPAKSVPQGTMDDALVSALREYTDSRHEDLNAICDLAMANYEEMRHAVTTPLYKLRKRVDGLLSRLTPFTAFEAFIPRLKQETFLPTPRGWLALYTMVTFRPDISYAEVKRKARRQDTFINNVAWSGLMFVLGTGSLFAGLRFWRRLRG
ncbi:kynurenine 3-monooxygenase, mitochondrial precursor [Serendipita sp. 405]|nr:kynurenine 3-monooxygenase, mitochondrial precursor [Serendipita sp. 405]